MKRIIGISCIVIFFVMTLALPGYAAKDENRVDVETLSSQTKRCIGCHENSTPGIVEDWYASLHAQITPQKALQKPGLARRISADSVSEDLAGNTVGCYECHGLNVDKHRDSFNHFGLKINVIVSPD